MANLDQFKLPDKAATVSYAQLNLNENHSHLDIRVNPKLYRETVVETLGVENVWGGEGVG